MSLPTHWTTKDGSKILISDMTYEHLNNTIKLLERHAAGALEAEIDAAASAMGSLSGDMATYAAEGEFDSLCDADPQEWLEHQPMYKALAKERNKKKP